MNAIVAVRREDSLHLYTDGAICDAHGVLTAIQANVRMLPHWSAAVATRGTHEVPGLLQLYWPGSAATFDEAVLMLPQVAEAILRLLERDNRPRPHFEIVVAGWSEEEGGFEVFDLWGGPPAPDGPPHPPFTLRRLTASVGMWPRLSEDDLPPLDRDATPEAIGRPLMTAARLSQTPHRVAPHILHHAVGGFVQETVLSRAACSTRILTRWHDRIGEQIVPVQSSATPSATRQ